MRSNLYKITLVLLFLLHDPVSLLHEQGAVVLSHRVLVVVSEEVEDIQRGQESLLVPVDAGESPRGSEGGDAGEVLPLELKGQLPVEEGKEKGT